MTKFSGTKFLLLLSAMMLPSFCFSQKAKTHVLTMDEAKLVKKDAGTLFASGDYIGALPAYKNLIKSDPENIDYNFKLGYCYLETTENKKAAQPYLEKAAKSKDSKKEWQFYLGLARMYNNMWDDASAAFSEFKNSKQKQLKDFLPVDRMIEMCLNGKEFSLHPVSCTYTNLGKTINTSYEEYNPFISADGKELVYTSRRKGNVGGFIEDLGIFTSDIYSSLWKDTIWSKARGLGGLVNSEWDEESVGLSPAGDMVLIYFDNVEFYADLGVSLLKGKAWQRPAMMSTQINSKQYEGAGTISLDGSTVYFSSNRKDGVGDNDLWMSRKGKNGEWSEAVNLGKDINTKYDEESPYLTLDGKALYFSSKGWDSMGGLDIFRSDWDAKNNKWGKPVNIGFPLNDADDNDFISFTGDMRFAYIAAVRPEGLGNRDIYKVEFNDTVNHPFTSFLTGNVTSSTGGKTELTKIYLENKSSGEKTEYAPGTAGNNFVLPVSAGNYTLHVEGYNFAPYSEDLTIEAAYPPKETRHDIQVKSSK